MWQELFKSGELLLPAQPSGAAETVSLAAGHSPLALVLLGVFLLLVIFLTKPFLELLPHLFDSFFRMRGSSTLEQSVRYSSDRTFISLSLLIPAVLLIYRYRLWSPSFLDALGPDARLGCIVGAVLVYVFLREMMYVILRPRRSQELYRRAHNACFTFFIFLMILVLATVGVLTAVGVEDDVIALVILIETSVMYLSFLLRRARILALFCNPLRTFLYLCALEILPTALLVVSSVLL